MLCVSWHERETVLLSLFLEEMNIKVEDDQGNESILRNTTLHCVSSTDIYYIYYYLIIQHQPHAKISSLFLLW